MNPITTELTKAAVPEIATTTKDFILKLFGPAVDEVGLMLAERRRLQRFQAEIKILERAKEMVETAHLDPKKIPFKILVPLLDAASLEEDEDLQEKWAALLANSASFEGNVLPSFVEVLRQISPAEAKLIDALAQQSFYNLEGFNKISIATTDPALNGLSMEQIKVLVSSLSRNDLLKDEDSTPRPGVLLLESSGPNFVVMLADARFNIYPTSFGRAFMKACHDPNATTQ